ncbi:MAG TPA: alpha/beta hydrolase [Caulobacteraceae bacterium]|nr:alpha/beta hydrolase [Caulobacteraceae bacterium]
MGEPAPLYGSAEAPVPAGASAEWVVGAGRKRLRAALFPALGQPRGSVILSGGRTEPIEKYLETAAELTARGFVVLAHDWRGQGLSERLLGERLKGHAVRSRDFVEDMHALESAFEARLPKPWLAIGHSMGGCLSALVLAMGERRVSAAVLTAPMFGILLGGVPEPVARALAAVSTAVGLGATLTPGSRMDEPVAPFKDNILTHDAARYARNNALIAAHPDLALGPPTFGWLQFAFHAMDELRRGQAVTRVETPVTVIAAGADRIADNQLIRQVTERFPRGRYVEVPGAFHEILQETDEIRAVFWREFDALADAVAPRAAAA